MISTANWRHLALSLCAVLGLLIASPQSRAADVVPLANAHAHNDYEHKRPLADALAEGFCSVEADVYLVDGELLVAHNRPDVRPERTLEALYLAPLRARVKENGGRVYRDGPPFTLLIDFKSEGKSTYEALAKRLAPYADMLTVTRDGQTKPGAVDIVISGNRPIELIQADPVRYAAIDGRMKDLTGDLPADLIPLVSDSWSTHFRWRGQGEMPAAEKEKLQDLVKQAHSQQRRVRFWAIPSTTATWQTLADAGVDLINTDDLPGLAEFLRKRPTKQRP